MGTLQPDIKFSKGICQGCIPAKHLECKYEKGRVEKVSAHLELIHSDINRPFPTMSLSNEKYVLTFDDYSRFCWVYFLKNKLDLFQIFLDFKVSVENSSRNNIKTLQTNNGGEYIKK